MYNYYGRIYMSFILLSSIFVAIYYRLSELFTTNFKSIKMKKTLPKFMAKIIACALFFRSTNLLFTNPKKNTLTLLLCLCVMGANATTYYWVGGASGNWNTATNWSTTSGTGTPGGGNGAVPTTTDIAIFDSSTGNENPSVDMTGLTITVDQLTLQGAASNVTFTAPSSFTVNTTLTLTSGALTIPATKLTMANGSTINCSGGSLTNVPQLGTSAAHRVNVTISGTCTSGNEIQGTTPGAYGLLTISGTSVYTYNPASNATFYTGLTLSGSAAGALTISTGKSMIFPNGATITHSGSANIINNAGSGAFQVGLSAANGGAATDRVNLVCSGTAMINAPIGSNTTYGVTGAGYGSLQVTAGSSTLNCSPTVYSGVSISSGAALTLVGGYSISIAGGNWSNAGTFTANSTSSTAAGVTFKGTNQTISNTNTGTETFYNLIINTASNTVTLSNNTTVVGNLTLTAGTLANGNYLTMANGSTINRSATGSLTAAPYLGITATDRVNVTISGTCTSGYEILSNSPGKYGLLKITGTAVYTYSPSITWTANTSLSSATVALTAAHPGILAGMYVTGTGIPAGVTVQSVSGTTLTLSTGTGVTAQTGTILTFSIPQTFTGCTTTNAGTTLTLPSKNGVGAGATVICPNVPAATLISSVSSTQNAVTLSANATATASNLTATLLYNGVVPFYSGLELAGTASAALTISKSYVLLFPNGATITYSGSASTSMASNSYGFQVGLFSGSGLFGGGAATDRVNIVSSGTATINSPVGTNTAYGVAANGAASAGYGSLSVTGGTCTLGVTPTLYGGVSISSGATLKGNTGYGVNLAGGDWNNAGTYNPNGTFFLGFKGTSQSINNTSGTETFVGLNIASSTTNTTTANCNITTTGALAVSSSNTLLVSANKTLILSAASTNAGNISLNGALQQNTGGALTGAGTITYNSGSTLNYNATTNTESLWPTSGGPTNVNIIQGGLTLTSAKTVNGTLTLGGGTLTNGSYLTLGSGATVACAAGTLAAIPTFGTSVNLTYSGTATKGNEFPSADIINSLTANNTAGITLADNRNIPNISIGSGSLLTVNAGKQLTVSTSMSNAGTLNLLSDASGTATILTPATISGSGTTTVQQYLATSRNWYMGSPVTGAIIPASGYGFYSYPESDVNQGTSGTNPFVWTPGNYWSVVTPTGSNTFDVMRGYIVKPTTGDAPITFSGTLNNGDKTLSNLTRSVANTGKPGFNLVANPYPSYLNWTQAIDVANTGTTNLLSTIWFRTKNQAQTPACVFDTFNDTPGVGTNNNQLGAVTGNIPPMQAFWVRVSPGQSTGSLALTNTMRGHRALNESSNNFRVSAVKNSTQQLLRLQVANEMNSDETILLFNPKASNSLDAFDSEKMTNGNVAVPEIYTLVDGTQTVINGMNSIPYDTEIPLGFTTGTAGTFSIKASQIANFDPGTQILLKDNVATLSTDLSDGSSYVFTSDISSNNTSRFALIFKSSSVATGINSSACPNLWISVNGANQIVLNGNAAESSVTVYNVIGQKVYAKNLISGNTSLDTPLQSGVYLVSVRSGAKTVSKKVIID